MTVVFAGAGCWLSTQAICSVPSVRLCIHLAPDWNSSIVFFSARFGESCSHECESGHHLVSRKAEWGATWSIRSGARVRGEVF